MKINQIKISFLLLSSILSFFFYSTVSFAIGVSPTHLDLKAKPGDLVENKLTISNTENIPTNYSVLVQDYSFDQQRNTKVFSDNPLPRGLKNWIKFEKTETNIDPDKSFDFIYSIQVPADAAPGTYTSAIAASTKAPSSQVAMNAKAYSYISLTIEGDYTESLSLESFEIDKNAFNKGSIIFYTIIKNTGDVSVAPNGNITIYDEKGDQVKGIISEYQTFLDKKVEIGRKDSIIVNPYFESTIPGETHQYMTPWENRVINPGKYTAKLELFNGEKQQKYNSSLEFEILENFIIEDFMPENNIKSSLPITFSLKLKNTGNVTIEPTGYFEITNVFGSQKKRVDFTKEELTMIGGEEKILSNLSWDSGFALGLYDASIYLDVGGKLYNKTTSFWIINWWQIVILIFVLVLIIGGIYLGVRSYIKLRKKLKAVEKEHRK